LETHEEIQPTLAMLPPGRSHKTTKRVHAEHHESTLDAGRASFALPIPGGATPEFTTSGGKSKQLENKSLKQAFLQALMFFSSHFLFTRQSNSTGIYDFPS